MTNKQLEKSEEEKEAKETAISSLGAQKEVIKIPQKILFVCTGNMDRSPTAENLLRGKEDFEVMSAGTWMHAHRRISESILDWAEKIFVMEREHKEAILRLKPNVENKIVVFGIPNNYLRNDPELIKLLKTKLSEHLKIEW